MTILSLIIAVSRHGVEAFKREQTRHYLLTLNERALVDLGFDRELLEQGISAYPWRSSSTDTKLEPLSRSGSNQIQTLNQQVLKVSSLAAMHY
jgi:uncharacterized protein YjiS (DUF1127 family)